MGSAASHDRGEFQLQPGVKLHLRVIRLFFEKKKKIKKKRVNEDGAKCVGGEAAVPSESERETILATRGDICDPRSRHPRTNRTRLATTRTTVGGRVSERMSSEMTAKGRGTETPVFLKHFVSVLCSRRESGKLRAVPPIEGFPFLGVDDELLAQGQNETGGRMGKHRGVGEIFQPGDEAVIREHP